MSKHIFKRLIIGIIVSLNLIACTNAEDESSGLLADSGHKFQICNRTNFGLELLERYQEGKQDYISLWLRVGPYECVPVSSRQTNSDYYIQSTAGRYVPGPTEYSYDSSNQGIVCWDRSMLFSKKAQYSYDGNQVLLTGICPNGMDRKSVASLKWTIDAVGDQDLIYTALISTGKIDESDRIDGWKYVDFSASELDRIKREITKAEESIERIKDNLKSCGNQITQWQRQKIFSLDTNEIASFEACSDSTARRAIKSTIDEAKEKTRKLLQDFLDSANGFFTRILTEVNSVLSETFGFDQGALSSFVGAKGSTWSQQPVDAFVPELNQALDASYGRDHKEFLETAHDGLLVMAEQGQRILNQLNDEQAAFSYLKQATSVREHLEGRKFDRVEEIDSEGWPTDSPVPQDIRQVTIKQKIAPRDPERAARLEAILKQWHSAGVPETVIKQRLAYIDALRALGDGFVAAASDVPEVLTKMRDILDGAITAAKDVSTCIASVGVGGDFVDWYELTQGRDYCNGNELSFSGRVVSAVGLVAGSAKFWRVMGEAVGISVNSSRVFKKTEEVIDSAKRFELPPAKLGEYMGRLREAGRTKGNFDLPKGNKNEANFLGESWVGPNAKKVPYQGQPGLFIYISQDGLKQFRPPVVKQDGRTLANFQWKDPATESWFGNGHMEVID